MNDRAVPSLKIGELQANGSQDPGRLRIAFAGVADMRYAMALSAYMPTVHSAALRLRVSEVIVDLRALEFMSSSCFKPFVTWLVELQETRHKYRVRFVSNKAKTWQARSLRALSCFAVDLAIIED